MNEYIVETKPETKTEDFINVLQCSSYIKDELNQDLSKKIKEEIKEKVKEEVKEEIKDELNTNIRDFINILQYSSLFKKKEKKFSNVDYSTLFEKDSINYNILM